MIMLNFEKVNEMLKSLNVFFRCKVFKFSIESEKIFVILYRKIMNDMRQLKWYVSILDLGGFKIMYKRSSINFNLLGFIRFIIDIM